MDHEKLIQELRGLRRIVINTCHGGFGLSGAAKARYAELSGCDAQVWDSNIARDDPYLVQTVLELGEASHGAHADLKVVEVPADVDWEIDEYDGREWVAEKHRTWE